MRSGKKFVSGYHRIKVAKFGNFKMLSRTISYNKKQMKSYSLSEMKDKYIGKAGTPDRDKYEYELRMDVLGRMIKQARQERNLTQEQLGQLVGVQKSQISKLESSTNSATIDTLIKVFKALKAEINFNVKLEEQFVKLA
jgi:DNA-binding XRE family transcriptional regulator